MSAAALYSQRFSTAVGSDPRLLPYAHGQQVRRQLAPRLRMDLHRRRVRVHPIPRLLLLLQLQPTRVLTEHEGGRRGDPDWGELFIGIDTFGWG